jgi:hypothetical protein
MVPFCGLSGRRPLLMRPMPIASNRPVFELSLYPACCAEADRCGDSPLRFSRTSHLTCHVSDRPHHRSSSNRLRLFGQWGCKSNANTTHSASCVSGLEGPGPEEAAPSVQAAACTGSDSRPASFVSMPSSSLGACGSQPTAPMRPPLAPRVLIPSCCSCSTPALWNPHRAGLLWPVPGVARVSRLQIVRAPPQVARASCSSWGVC